MKNNDQLQFPKDFTWGAASASYQIEGSLCGEGRGRCVWDEFSHADGNVKFNENGDFACRHIENFKEDVALMQKIGLQAYRFSISWTRIAPSGRLDFINNHGVDFYDQLIDELLAVGITSYVTLFHWDFPQNLMTVKANEPGWLNRDCADYFADYAGFVTSKFSDRVCNWLTLNEPECFIGLGHGAGIHAPGLKLGLPDLMKATHHTLLAHGKAVRAIRANAKKTPRIGFALMAKTYVPSSEQPTAVKFARKYTFGIFHKNSWETLWSNAWWLEPIYAGRYPKEIGEVCPNWQSFVANGDLETISEKLDFFGMNNYFSDYVDEDGKILKFTEGFPRTKIGWQVTPEGLFWSTKFFYDRFNLPIYITENGLSSMDWVCNDGKVHDYMRIDFLCKHLEQVKKAIDSGVDIRGYFQWSIMDNFEWGEGYGERFGLIHIDYKTQKRTLKDSAYWYKDLIAQKCA